MATASKLDAAPLAILLPGAFILRYLTVDRKSMNDDTVHRSSSIEYWTLLAIYLIAGAVASILSFRIFMPYAFHGLGLNPAWVANMKELVGQSSGDVDVPFALQWARRSHLFSFDNLTTLGTRLAAWHPGLDRFPCHALENHQRRIAPSFALGLDGNFFHLAIHGIQSDHALSTADLSIVVHDGGMVRDLFMGSGANVGSSNHGN